MDEGRAKFGARIITERFKLYSQHFKEYPQFALSQYDFNRVCKVTDGKITNWRSKEDKHTYLKTFSVDNWNEGTCISKEIKRAHCLTNCKACTTLHSNLQATFPLSKKCMTVRRGPLSEIKEDTKHHTARIVVQNGLKMNNHHLKTIGQTIYFTCNEKCKENLGKSLRDVLILVPEAGLERKLPRLRTLSRSCMIMKDLGWSCQDLGKS